MAWLNCEKTTDNDWYRKTIAIDDSETKTAKTVKINLTRLSIGWCLLAVVVSTCLSEWWTAWTNHRGLILCCT